MEPALVPDRFSGKSASISFGGAARTRRPNNNRNRRSPIKSLSIFAAGLLASTAIAAPALAQDQMDETQADTTTMSTDATVDADTDIDTDAQVDTAVDAQADVASDAPAEADPLAGIPVEQRNAAIEAFTMAQTAQASGDYAGAVASLMPHLDTIRAMAATGDAQSQGFLADALTTVAVSKAQSGDVTGIDTLLKEAVPARRAVYEANSADANARLALVNSLNSTGNVMLQTADKPAAEPYFKEAADLAEAGYNADTSDAALGNAYLTAAIGMNNVTADPEWYAKVKTIAVALNTAGTLDPSLAPVVQPLLGG